MSTFEIYVGLTIICGIFSLTFLFIAFILLIKEKPKPKPNAIFSAFAGIFSGLCAFLASINISIPTPVILPLNNETTTYVDSLEVTIKPVKSNLLETYYTLDGEDPEENGKIYEEAITITDSTTVCARNKFLGKWSEIVINPYVIEKAPLSEETSSKELSKTLFVSVDGNDVEIDRKTKIPVDSDYPNISMEAKMTSIFDTHVDQDNYIGYDIISDPFISDVDNIEGLYQEVKEEILRNPVYGDMIARGLVYDSNWFSDNILWLNDFIEKSDSFYNMKKSSDKSVGVEKWLMMNEYDPDKYYVNVDYRIYAEKICQLLDGFTCLGVYSYAIDGYWSLNIDFGSHKRAIYMESKSDAKDEALILCKKTTNGTVISILGFDLRDKGLLHYKHSTLNL